MGSSQKNNPPRWAQNFLQWYCKEEVAEDLQGDLNEYFQRNVKTNGIKRARFIYVIDVIKFIRPYTIRKPKFLNLLIQWIMIGSYIKTSGRSLVRNKLFSAINIFGLAVSMSVGLLLIAMLTDMHKYDRFHENGDRIYRVISQYSYLDQANGNYNASTSLLAGRDIKESIPGIEGTAILYSGLENDVTSENKTVPFKGFWANENLFSIFSFKLIDGDPATALKNPFSLVLTQTAEKKLFGDVPSVGKVVRFSDNNEFTITGIVADPPKFSHIQFEILASLGTRAITEKDRWGEEMSWDNMWQAYTYLLLPKNADLENIQHNLDAIAVKNDKTVEHTKIKLALQPLYDIVMGDDLNNSVGPVMGKGEAWMIGILTLVVIFSACFNYTNLSVARATKRLREVGIRKVLGAYRRQVLYQFVVEAVIVSLMALIIAFVFFLLLKPYFLVLQPKMQQMLNLDLSVEVILYFLLLASVVGLFAGVLPATIFSRINAIQVLKDTSSLRLFRHLNLRKSLIVLQYTVSLMLIAITVIGFKQYNFMLSFDLGYNTENILNIYLNNNESKASLIANQLRTIPEVQNVSESQIITSVGSYWTAKVKYKDPADSSHINYNGVDENYIPLHGIKLIAGRNFTPLPDSAIESEVIVNEKLLKRFQIGNADPGKALDEILEVNNIKMKIVGVLKNFHYGKADNIDEEVIFRYFKNKGNFLNVKLTTTDFPTTLAKIDRVWKEFDNVHPLQAQLYKDRITHSYREISSTLRMIGFLAFLAICIASFGLLGMVVFTTETRVKEVSIRKVLGASEGMLVYLLGKGFFILLFISAIIALPITYLFFEQLLFPELVNHTSIGLFDLTAGFFVVLLISLVMIGTQTLKIARSNPASVLKSE